MIDPWKNAGIVVDRKRGGWKNREKLMCGGSDVCIGSAIITCTWVPL